MWPLGSSSSIRFAPSLCRFRQTGIPMIARGKVQQIRHKLSRQRSSPEASGSLDNGGAWVCTMVVITSIGEYRFMRCRHAAAWLRNSAAQAVTGAVAGTRHRNRKSAVTGFIVNNRMSSFTTCGRWSTISRPDDPGQPDRANFRDDVGRRCAVDGSPAVIWRGKRAAGLESPGRLLKAAAWWDTYRSGSVAVGRSRA